VNGADRIHHQQGEGSRRRRRRKKLGEEILSGQKDSGESSASSREKNLDATQNLEDPSPYRIEGGGRKETESIKGDG